MPRDKKVRRSHKLRIGRYSQHFVDVLQVPLRFFRSLRAAGLAFDEGGEGVFSIFFILLAALRRRAAGALLRPCAALFFRFVLLVCLLFAGDREGIFPYSPSSPF